VLLNNQWAPISSFITASDANPNDRITQYEFWDRGTGFSSGYFWTPGNEHHAADTRITVAAADIGSVFVRGGSAAGSETLQVRVFDGTDWSNLTSFTLTTQMNALPVVTMPNAALQIGGAISLNNFYNYSDANNQLPTQYELWDGGTAASSAYFYSGTTGVRYGADQSIIVSAANMANTYLHAGTSSGTEIMYVRAFDGLEWGAWDSFTMSSVNTAPVAAIGDHSLPLNQWQAVSNWLSYSDVNGQAAVRYEFWDTGTAANSGYFWTPGNEHHAAGAGASFTVEAANLNSVFVRGGSVTSTETMRVRAFDGEAWGAWDDFSLISQPNAAPVAAIGNLPLQTNQWLQVNGLLSYSDANGHAATMYEFWDGGVGANSGYFYSSRSDHHAADTSIVVSAAELASVWIRGGAVPGSETMFVRAFDGYDWGAWDPFTLTTFAAP
jgi:hypothetical protein